MKTPIKHGFCLCGCGQKTFVSTKTDRAANKVKGQPAKYIKGHNFRESKQGEKSPNWKGGRQLSSHGYVVVWTPEGRQYEHIVVAEKAIGRKLKYITPGHPDNEVVHHINGYKLNNGNNNLLVCTHAYHTELHHRLELSPEWPEFAKIIRNDKRASKCAL